MANNENKPKTGNSLMWIYGVILLFIIVSFMFLPDRKNNNEISFEKFSELADKKVVKKVLVVNEKLVEVYLTNEALKTDEYKSLKREGFLGDAYPTFTFRVVSGEKLEEFLIKNKIDYEPVERTDYISSLFSILFPIFILIALSLFFMRRMGGGVGGGQIFNIGKSKATLFDQENQIKINFSNVAGLDEAKQEVQEIVEFLKNPKKFTRLGGHIPKGVLLIGPPGTGKTLLAKAVAGEANVPFFSLSGSDFVEMFVGVGAARVRDLFKTAKEKAPCIIFIDEVDAIGRSRGRGNVTGGNDERENTLNQLLVEMDGFNTDAGVILIAATNRPDILDNALMRPGRFDRQISVDRPDIKEREAIFKVHLSKITIATELDVAQLASQTPGFVGADIMNVCNEAALIAARKEKNAVDMQDFQDAIDRVIGGLEKKNKIIKPREKKIVAYHEAGHAITGWFMEHSDPLVKVTIVPRGVAALGYAQYLPNENFLRTKSEMIDRICVALGGRVAEDIVFGEISTGAVSDLEMITKMAHSMITIYGMNDVIGNISFYNFSQDEYSFNKPYSDKTSENIDIQVKLLVDTAYARVKSLLNEKRDLLEKLSQELLVKEVLFKKDLDTILGPRPFAIEE